MPSETTTEDLNAAVVLHGIAEHTLTLLARSLADRCVDDYTTTEPWDRIPTQARSSEREYQYDPHFMLNQWKWPSSYARRGSSANPKIQQLQPQFESLYARRNGLAHRTLEVTPTEVESLVAIARRVARTMNLPCVADLGQLQSMIADPPLHSAAELAALDEQATALTATIDALNEQRLAAEGDLADARAEVSERETRLRELKDGITDAEQKLAQASDVASRQAAEAERGAAQEAVRGAQEEAEKARQQAEVLAEQNRALEQQLAEARAEALMASDAAVVAEDSEADLELSDAHQAALAALLSALDRTVDLVEVDEPYSTDDLGDHLDDDLDGVQPGELWFGLRGRHEWTLSKAARKLVRREDDRTAQAVYGPAAQDAADRFLALRPSGGRVWVDDHGRATTLIDGHLTYLGPVRADDDDDDIDRLPVGTPITKESWKTLPKYTLKVRGGNSSVVRHSDERSLSSVVGRDAAVAVARRLGEVKRSGGKIGVDGDGTVVGYVDGQFVVVGHVEPDEWF